MSEHIDGPVECSDCGGWHVTPNFCPARPVRREIQALIERGRVTPAEIAELRCNSWEWQALVPAMDDEAFAGRFQHTINNCFTPGERPFSTYNTALEGLYAPELLRRYKRLREELTAANKKWQDYERDYILPCFKQAKDFGYDLEKAVRDNPGRNCVELWVAWLTREARGAREFGDTIDAIRETLGQKETHYLVMPDDIETLVKAVAWYAQQPGEVALRAILALGCIRNQATVMDCESCGKRLIVANPENEKMEPGAIFCDECGGGCMSLPMTDVLP